MSNYETRRPGREWTPVTEPIRDAMQRIGFRFSELPDHQADLDAGYVLTSERGTEFRAVVVDRAVVHLFEDCRDFVSGNRVVDALETYGDVTCGHCRAVAGRFL